jgi:hypothetical protein
MITALVSYAQFQPVNLWWKVHPNGGGKIIATNPATNFNGVGITPDSTMWELCAKPAPGFDFLMWTIRYYHVSEGITNDTVTNDWCIYVDTNNYKIREIACIAFFEQYLEIDDVLIRRDVILYPNPTSEVIYFNTEVEEYRIYNYEGKLIGSGYYTNFIDLSSEGPGMYLIQTEKRSFRVIKL